MKGPFELVCGADARALGIEDESGDWNLDKLQEHARACVRCGAFLRLATERLRETFRKSGSIGGSAGRGKAKRRGGPDYYRRLVAHRWKKA